MNETPETYETPETPEVDYGTRLDGTKKGKGYFGLLHSTNPKDGKDVVSSELSATTERVRDAQGQEVLFPLLVPSLSMDEIELLLSGETPTDTIYAKAEQHALMRMGKQLSPFASAGEQQALPASDRTLFNQGFDEESGTDDEATVSDEEPEEDA